MIYPGDDGIGRGMVTRYSPGVLLGNWYEEMRQKEDKLQLFKRKREEAEKGKGGRGGVGVSLYGTTKEDELRLIQRLQEPVDVHRLLSTLPKEEQLERLPMEDYGGVVAPIREAHLAKQEVLADKIYRPEYCYTSWAPMPSPAEEGIVSYYPPEMDGGPGLGGSAPPPAVGGCVPTGWSWSSGEGEAPRVVRDCHLRPRHPREGPPPCVAPRGRPVPLGVPLMILSVKTGAALALDCTARRHQGVYEALVTASPCTVPMVRTTWTVFPCPDENNAAYHSDWMKEPHILHYGQRIRIGNENIASMGNYYLQGDLENGYNSSIPRTVKASMGACMDNIFVIGRPGYRRGDPTSDGYPVRLGDPITLIHVASNQPLCCVGEDKKRVGPPVLVSTRFGAEYPITCMVERTGRYGLSRGDVVVMKENMFCFATGTESDGPRMKSQQTCVNLEEVAPMSFGNAVEQVLHEIRAGAIQMGGRLGLRPLSMALRTAGAEGRYPFFLNRQGLLERMTKLGVYILPVQLDAIMKVFDHTGNNEINAVELMRAIRGDMNPTRMKAVVTAFQRLLMEGKGSVEFSDMYNLYCENSHGHPDVMDGLITRSQACKDFELCWPSNIIHTKLGTVRLDEFVTYYADLSPAVYDDRRFCATLRNCWMIPLTDAYRQGIPFRVITVEHINGEKETVRVPNTMSLNPENRDGIFRMLRQHGVTNIKDFSVSDLM